MVCNRAGPSIKHCAYRQAEVYSVKQYQFKLSVDLKRLQVLLRPPRFPNMSETGRLRTALGELLAEHERDGALPTSARFLFHELVQRSCLRTRSFLPKISTFGLGLVCFSLRKVAA
jgi:hypothetical protein